MDMIETPEIAEKEGYFSPAFDKAGMTPMKRSPASPFIFRAGIARLPVFLAALATAPAWATPCDDALNRFDYRAVRTIAQEQLDRQPGDAPAWICLARGLYETGRFAEALSALRRTDTLSMNASTRVLADNWYGVTLRRLDRRAEAWDRLGAALALARQNHDQAGLATALHNTAGLLYDAGRAIPALDYYRQSLAINPDAAERSASLNNMGLIEADRGNPAAAARLLEAAIALNRQHGHFHHLGKHLMNLGNLRRGERRFDEAEALIREGAALVERADDRYWIAVSHRLAAWLANDRGRKRQAARLLQQAARDYAMAGTPMEEAATRDELARLGPVTGTE
jgi:tetratricopeptide (TPR) repeat protein